MADVRSIYKRQGYRYRFMMQEGGALKERREMITQRRPSFGAAKMELAVWLVLLFLAVARATQNDCVVVAPNSVQLEESVLVINQGDAKYVTLQVQDFPARLNTFYRETIHLSKDEIRKVKLRTGTQQLQREETYAARYIALSVQCGSLYTKEARLMVSEKSGYLFLQTDKPIYSPKQTVRIRFVAVGEHLRPLDGPFSLEIKNPQDIVTYKTVLEGNGTGMFSQSYDFPRSPLLGEWTVTASYGPHPDQMTEVKFKVDEYVLPTFSVNLSVPAVILTDQDTVSGSVTARYVYGKPVEGSAVFRFKVKNEANSEREIGSVSHKELVQGTTSFTIRTADLKMPRSQRWAPMVRGNRLVVEVIVMDGATGKRESAINDMAVFANSPYIISFKSTPRDFRPGTRTIVVALVEHPNSTPASGVRTQITVLNEREQRVPVDVDFSITDDGGKAIFFIQTDAYHKRLKCKVRTADPRYSYHQQEENSINLETYDSRTNATLALNRIDTRRRYQVGEQFEGHVTVMPREMYPLYFVVLSKGHVEHYGVIMPGMPLHFTLTYNMSPTSRVLVYAFYKGHLLADALAFEVQGTCTDSSQIEIETTFKTHEPGEAGALRVKGTEGTLVGILAVDQAVYILRKKDLLTRNRLFAALRSHDLGCGPGGGLTSETVIANAGVVIISHHLAENTIHPDNSCEARVRKRRSIMLRSRASHTDIYLQKCCSLGQRSDKFGRDCRTRAEIVRRFLNREPRANECADAFRDCCRDSHATSSMMTRRFSCTSRSIPDIVCGYEV
ncbi:complement C3-like [Ornithodoros turicata]|uniref:complement C3-like n=1 Tax=Ornithodoros turicata TaxID=34597 RepID=UPI003139E2C2